VTPQRRVALPAREAGASEGYSLIDRAAVADLCRLADDDAGAVIDEDAAADRCVRMDLDRREKARDVGEEARKQGHAGAVQRVDEPMRDERMESGIGEHDVEPTARG